jgi:hypothetical protein
MPFSDPWASAKAGERKILVPILPIEANRKTKTTKVEMWLGEQGRYLFTLPPLKKFLMACPSFSKIIFPKLS